MNPEQARLQRWAKTAIGGPMGAAAWIMSGFAALAVAFWGLSAALPVLIIKTASWGLWGIGVIRESRKRPPPMHLPRDP